jgi:hypothetical protein
MNNVDLVLDETIELWSLTRCFCIVTYKDATQQICITQAIPEGIHQKEGQDYISFNTGLTLMKKNLLDMRIVRSDNLPDLY